MNGFQLTKAGTLLFGIAWRAPFERQYKIGSASLRRMIKDMAPIPAGLAREVEIDLRDRANEIDELLWALCDTPEALEVLAHD